jgi:hypothetical protein
MPTGEYKYKYSDMWGGKNVVIYRAATQLLLTSMHCKVGGRQDRCLAWLGIAAGGTVTDHAAFFSQVCALQRIHELVTEERICAQQRKSLCLGDFVEYVTARTRKPVNEDRKCPAKKQKIFQE